MNVDAGVTGVADAAPAGRRFVPAEDHRHTGVLM